MAHNPLPGLPSLGTPRGPGPDCAPPRPLLPARAKGKTGQPIARIGVYEDVEPLTDAPPDAGARQQVTAPFEAHALGLVRLAKVMLGDQSIAEDVVQAG
jgi:hypothetical protein